MSLPYVCFRCRAAITVRRLYTRKASFVSLGKLVDGDKSEQQLFPKRKDSSSEAQNPSLASYPVKRNRKHQDHRLESLFSSSIRRKDTTFDLQPFKSTKNVPPVYVVPARTLVNENIQTLQHLLYQQRASLVEIWKACQELLGSETWQQMVSDAGNEEDIVFTVAQLDIFRDILLHVAHTRSRHPERIEIPLVANAIRAFRRHNMMKCWWDHILWRQLSGYLQLIPSYSWATKDRAGSITVLEEIIEVWRLLIHEYGEPADSSIVPSRVDHSSSLIASCPGSSGGGLRWSRLPSQVLDADPGQLPENISERFSEYWPRHPGSTGQTNRMITAAIMSFDCLKRAQLDGFATNDSKSLTRFLTPLVQGGKIKWDVAVKSLTRETISLPMAERIVRDWGTKWINVTAAPPSKKVSTSPQAAKQEALSTSSSSDFADKFSKTLSGATAKADVAMVTSLWQRFIEQVDSDKIEESHRHELFSQFLSAYFTLRRHAEAVKVWNFMVHVNYQPTLKHWNAMLAGCTAAKDLTSLREIRSNMLTVGIKSDLQTWTSWIHGLMACGDWQSGLRALEDLERAWKRTPDADRNSSDDLLTAEDQLKPSLVPVRAALAGLAQSNNIDLANAVLDWAQQQNLTLDTETYNIILRPAVRANDEPKVQSILQRMQSDSCHPDIATFTIMLNGLLSNPSSTFHTRSPSEQQSAVFAILHDMERNGLKANAYTYGTILDGLLDSRIFNIEAAKAVMYHMTKNNIEPSPHVYTILITHYFSLSPPNLSAIDTLLHRIRLEKTPLDPIFWDRMIESYARVGETEKMLFILRRMPEEGRSPGWMSLLACLRALVEAREWENVRELVRDVEDVNGVLRHGSGPWRGKDAFWELVGEVKRERLRGSGGWDRSNW